MLVRNGVLVAPVRNYTVGLDAETGHELWRYVAPFDSIADPTAKTPGNVADSRIDADDNTVFIPAWGASISAIDLKRGFVKWIWRPGFISGDTAISGPFRSGSMGLRLSGDTVYATMWHYVTRLGGQSEAWIVAIDRSTGREIWRFKLPYKGGGVLIEGAPVVYRNLAIVHTLSGRTYAIDVLKQSVAWEFTSPTATLSTIAEAELYGDNLYVDGGDEHVYALEALDGTKVWSAAFASQATRDLLVTERRVILTNGRTIYVFDRSTGTLVAHSAQPHTADPLFASAATYANGLVFVTGC